MGFEILDIGEARVTCLGCLTVVSVDAVLDNEGLCPTCDEMVCVICGCTMRKACVHPSFPNGELTCEWQDVGLCSFCFQKEAEIQYKAVTQNR